MHTTTTTVLLVGHGSRREGANDSVQQFAAVFQARFPIYRIRLCFLEYAFPRLDEALHQAAKESSIVIVIPLMLGAGGHVERDIPQHVAALRLCYLDVVFTISEHLGAADKVLHALLEQLKQVVPPVDSLTPTAGVLLARGSSNMLANGELAKMARWIFESSDCIMVDIAFSGLTTPLLETVVQRQISAGMKRIIIIPYYLFTGVLIERIAMQEQQLCRAYPTTVFNLTDAIGLSDSMYDLVDCRISECLGTMTCIIIRP